ncbi:MAG: hypothetical protein H5T83_00825, partial [Actinotalea sp.]|nr:hypothetical protein [Actinotalea sp.]
MTWSRDPAHHALLRAWSQDHWTRWVSDGRSVWADPRPTRRLLTPADGDGLKLVTDVVLPEAVAQGVVDPRTARRLQHVVDRLWGEAYPFVSP